MVSPIVANILSITRCCNSFRKTRLKDADLMPSHHWMLSKVCREPGTSQESMVEYLCMDKTTVAHRLTQLENSGYIMRKPSEKDQRCRLVYPTQKALDLYPRLHGSFEEMTDRLLKGLTPEELEELERLTDILRANARQMCREENAE